LGIFERHFLHRGVGPVRQKHDDVELGELSSRMRSIMTFATEREVKYCVSA